MIDFMAKPFGFGIEGKTGLTSCAMELPARTACVVGVAANGIGRFTPWSEEQTRAIPKTVVCILESDVVDGWVNEMSRYLQIELTELIPLEPGSPTTPAPTEIEPV